MIFQTKTRRSINLSKSIIFNSISHIVRLDPYDNDPTRRSPTIGAHRDTNTTEHCDAREETRQTDPGLDETLKTLRYRQQAGQVLEV